MWNKPHILNAIADLLILAAAAAVLAAGAVWLVRVPSLAVREVVFTQELPHTRRAEIEETLPAALKGNFFSLNLETVRSSMERLPWVRKVELRRTWPARLEVKIEEHRPVAHWGEGRGELVNTYGEVFAANGPDEEMAALPILYGPSGTAPEVLKRYAEFVGTFLQLGRLQRFIDVYPDMVGKRATRPAVVDLRYPNGFAMRVAGEVKGKQANEQR